MPVREWVPFVRRASGRKEREDEGSGASDLGEIMLAMIINLGGRQSTSVEDAVTGTGAR